MKFAGLLLASLVCLVNFPCGLQAAPAEMPPGFPSVKLPARQQGEAAIRSLGRGLGPVAAFYRMDEAALAALLRKDHDLWVDENGRLVYICNLHHENGPMEETSEPTLSAAQPLTDDQTFLLHSRPGATKVIYLDFDGHDGSSTQWGADAIARPFDTDSDPSTFSSAERAVVRGVWQRVAEDYAMYDVDVTTQEPGIDALRKSSTSDANYGVRVAIGGSSSDWYGSAGGVAYVGSFNWNTDTPCWVFPRSLSNTEKNIAEASSHEAGHTLGLSHDGQGTTTEYYSGQGNWAPIMGVGYSKPISQWSKGEYSNANQTQDDLARMLNYGVVYRPDDAGNSVGAATRLAGTSFTFEGNIETSSDVDYFSFVTGAGRVVLRVTPAPRGANLHVLVTVYNASGGVVTSMEPADTTAGTQVATLTFTADTGTYYVSVQGKGSGDPMATGYSDYASLGEYTLTGTLPSDSTWTPVLAGSAYSWIDPANWAANTIPLIAGSIARLNNNIQGAQSILLNTPVKIGELFLGDTDGSHSFTLEPGAGGTLTFEAISGSAYLRKSTGANDTLALPVVLQSDLQVVHSGAQLLSFDGPLSGPGALTKSGTGTLQVNGSCAFTGETVIEQGTLVLGQFATLLSNELEVREGAILDVQSVPAGLSLGLGKRLNGSGTVVGNLDAVSGSAIAPGGNAQVGTIHLTGHATLNGARLVCDLSSGGSNDVLAIIGDVVLSGPVEIQPLFPQTGAVSPGAYTIVTYTGALSGGETNLVLTNQNNRYTTSLDTSIYGEIRLVISGAPQQITWAGAGIQTTWQTAGPANWVDATATPTPFYQFDQVLFDDSVAGGIVNLAGELRPALVSVSSTQSYTFASSGKLSGNLSLHKTGTGILAINTINDFTGPTIVSGGTLKLGNAKALGNETGALTISAGGAVDLNALSLGAKAVNVSGTGAGTLGALLNGAGTSQPNAVRSLSLTGPTTLGGVGRWDVRANPTGSLAGNGFSLTKAGPNEIWLAELGSSGLGDIFINQGTLGFEGDTTAGDPTKTISISPSAKLGLRNLDLNVLNKKVVMNQATIQAVAGNNVLTGTLALSGSNVVDSGSATLAIKGVISGGGALAKTGTGTLSLAASNTFSGATYIGAGVLQARNGGALGSDVSGTRIVNDAQLDLNGFNLGAEQVTVAGDGIGNSGAIINNGSQQLNALRFVTLSGNATFGGINRWDIRANPTGSLVGNNFSLTKRGKNEVWLADLGNTGLGTISIIEGTLGFRGTSTMGNAGSTISISSGASVAFYANGANQLNKVMTVNSGEVYNGNGTNAFLGAVTLTGSNVFDIAASTLLEMKGSISGSGSLNKSGSGVLVLTGNSLQTGGTKILTGTLQVGDGNTGGTLGTAPVVNNSKLVLSRNTIWTVSNPISGTGSLQIGEADPSNALINSTLVLSGTNSYTGQTLIYGNGTMVAIGNDDALGSGGIFFNGNGNGASLTGLRSATAVKRTISNTVQLGTGGTFQFGTAGTGELLFDAPVMNTDSADKRIVVDNALTTIQSAIGNNSRVIKSGSGTLVLTGNNTNAGFSVNAGVLRIDSQARLGRNPVSFTPAHLSLNGGTLQTTTSFAIDNVNRGISLQDQGGKFYAQPGTTLTLGTLISGPGSLTTMGGGTVEIAAANTYSGATTNLDGTLLVSGTLSGSGVYVAGGTLGGTGISLGPVYVNPEATIAPGASIGTLIISNSLELAGTTIMEVDSSISASDLIRGVSQIKYGGTLVVTNIAGVPLAGGERFKLFDAASYEGGFTQVLPSVPGPSLAWDTSRLSLDGTIGVIAPALVLNEPTVTATEIVLSGCGGAPGAGFSILGSPDLNAPLSNWTVLSSGVLDGSGCFTFTNAVDALTPSRFYTIQFTD